MGSEPDGPIDFQFELEGSDLERVVVIGGDLEYLVALPRDRLPSHTEVRLAAGVLRRLLVDGQLDAIWRPIGQATRRPPTVRATDLDAALEDWPDGQLVHASAGGASAAGAHHAGIVVGTSSGAAPDLESLQQRRPIQRVEMTVSDWLKSTAMAIRSDQLGVVRISRRAVLKHIANRKGGVHFSPKRDLTLKDPKKRREEYEHILLDHGVTRVGHLSGTEFEIVSMLQVVADSSWAPQFVKAAHALAPADFSGDPTELRFWTGQGSDNGWETSRFGPPSG